MSSINDHTSMEHGPFARANLAPRERIDLLLEEYRAMYGLLSFRLGVVDQRVPLTAGALMAALGAVPALPAESQLTVLLLIPIGMSWLMRLTIAHARSKEDVLRRIDEIERQVNLLAGEELLAFQSRHPNRSATISSGRTGAGAVSSVLALSLAGLLGCLAQAVHHRMLPDAAMLAYVGYLVITMFGLLHAAVRLRRYRYVKSPPDHPPVGWVLGRPGTHLDDRPGRSHTL